jgi:hypothetical protein
MRPVIGFDISTACTGVCVIDIDKEIGTHDSIFHIGVIKFAGSDLWQKVDLTYEYLEGLKNDIKEDIVAIYVEEALLGFRPGKSNAKTITQLVKFNGLVSYAAREVFKIEPDFIASSRARKTCGVKVQRPSVCGKSHKEQTFDVLMANDLKCISWPTKKNSSDPVAWAMDATDAYVIAKAGILLNKA